MDKINWRKWSDEAFEESGRTGKPVLLGISAVWCHWCHVMDQTTYSDPRVIELINESFIAVRVDNDREPDINERYNMGGWPTTVFLTQNRDIITGGTYIPPDDMLRLAKRVHEIYTTQRDDLLTQAAEARAQEDARLVPGVTGAAKVEDVQRVLASIKSYYDTSYGGFGYDQKFPLIPVLELLLLSYERSGEGDYLDMVTHTLDGMLAGEIFDKVAGGMFRYATKRDWTVPHYEKMLGDNAGIASVLLDAYRITENESYLEAARGVFAYLDSTLRDSQTGAYFGSQDADEGYYAADAKGREQMSAPRVDTAVYTDTNAQLALAWLRLWSIAKDSGARDKARQIVEFFNGLPRASDGTVAHYFEIGQAHQYGSLPDQVRLALGNVVSYEATGDGTYLEAATALAEPLDLAFGSEDGAYYDISAARAAERGLSRRETPLSENSVLTVFLLTMAELADNPGYRWRAAQVLDALASRYEQYGIMAAEYAMAVSMANVEPVTVNVTGADGQTDALIQVSLAACGLRCAIKPQITQASPAASICVGTECRARTSDPDELAEGLNDALSWM